MSEKKRRPYRDASILHMILVVVLISTVCFWMLTGCPLPTGRSFLCHGSDYVLTLPGSVSAPKLERDDFTRLIDLENFTFLMNNLVVCNDSDPLLIAIVHSHPNNFLKRSTIRNTWGSVVGFRFKLVFLVGISPNKRLQTSLEEENKLYRDLIQGNFVDAYRNLTYKHVMGLKWVNYFCPNSRYILKADDDVFINSPALLDYISKKLLPYSVKNLLLCSPIFNSRVKRSSRSKWKVTFREYGFYMYPTYCEGFAIIYSPDVAFTLYAHAQSENYFWIDDVHITGFLAAKASLRHSSFGSSMLHQEELDRVLGDRSGIYSYLVGPFNLKEEVITKLWEKVSHSPNETKS